MNILYGVNATGNGHLSRSRITISELKKRGHNVTVEADWSLGRMTAASINNKILKAAANPRFMQGYAIGR